MELDNKTAYEFLTVIDAARHLCRTVANDHAAKEIRTAIAVAEEWLKQFPSYRVPSEVLSDTGLDRDES